MLDEDPMMKKLDEESGSLQEMKWGKISMAAKDLDHLRCQHQ